MIGMYKHAFGRFWLPRCRKSGLLQSQHRDPEAVENAFYLCDRNTGVSGRAKARSKEKREEEGGRLIVI